MKTVPATADACNSDPYGNPNSPHGAAHQTDPADSTPGLSWEGIGRELRSNSWQSNNNANSYGDDDQLSMKKMVDGNNIRTPTKLR